MGPPWGSHGTPMGAPMGSPMVAPIIPSWAYRPYSVCPVPLTRYNAGITSARRRRAACESLASASGVRFFLSDCKW